MADMPATTDDIPRTLAAIREHVMQDTTQTLAAHVLDWAHALANTAKTHQLVNREDEQRLFGTPHNPNEMEEGEEEGPPPSYNLDALSPFQLVESMMSQPPHKRA
jgi:hypothetical protein